MNSLERQVVFEIIKKVITGIKYTVVSENSEFTYIKAGCIIVRVKTGNMIMTVSSLCRFIRKIQDLILHIRQSGISEEKAPMLDINELMLMLDNTSEK